MFTPDAVALALCLAAVAAVAGEQPRLGEPMSAAAVVELDYTVLPDGDGLPPGTGNARDGEKIYLEHCTACHGAGGENGPNDRLVGGQGTLDSAAPVKTVGSYWPYATTLFDYIRRAMPYPAPGSLSDDDIYAVTAYVLHLNGIVRADEEMNAESLPDVQMPNRENFDWAFKP
jgi:cytochrome c